MNIEEGKTPYPVLETKKLFRSCTREDFLKVKAGEIYDTF